jgi:hypothetical protein
MGVRWRQWTFEIFYFKSGTFTVVETHEGSEYSLMGVVDKI